MFWKQFLTEHSTFDIDTDKEKINDFFFSKVQMAYTAF